MEQTSIPANPRIFRNSARNQWNGRKLEFRMFRSDRKELETHSAGKYSVPPDCEPYAVKS